MKLKLSTKTAVVLVVMVGVAILGAVGALIQAWHMRHTLHELVSRNVGEVLAASELDIALSNERDLVASYLLDNGNERWLDALHHQRPLFPSTLESFRKKAKDPDDRMILAQIEKSFPAYEAMRDEVVARYRSGDPAGAKQLYLNDLDRLYHETADQCDAIVKVNKVSMNEVLAASSQETHRFAYLLGVIALLISSLGVGLIWLLVTGVFRPLRRIAHEVRSLSPEGLSLAPDSDKQDDLDFLVPHLRLLMAEATKRRSRAGSDRGARLHAEHLATLGKTVAQVAHEINNRLVVLGGFAHLIEKRPEDTEQTKDRAHRIFEEVGRLENLLKQITQYSKPVELNLNPYCLNTLVEDVVAKLSPHVLAGIRLEVSLEPELPPALIDLERVEQVIINILRNAGEALRGSGAIRVSTRNEKGRATVLIEDDGPGIPAEVQRRIFDPFFTTKKQGTGLGLSVCKQIVAQHKGTIHLKSRPGKGATFRIELPLA
jgi:signal transduction histidine kinase